MTRRKQKSKSIILSNNLELVDVAACRSIQQSFFDNYDSGKSQLLLGYPGTGKTFLSMYKAFEEIANDPTIKRLVIVRSAVPTRDQGHLPGTIEEKSAAYEQPYKDICTELFGRADAYEILKKHKGIEFITTSFIRGNTLRDCIVILDEVQNLHAGEADSVITRLGDNSKILLCGDILQRDNMKHSEKNIEKFIKVVTSMTDTFDTNYFGMDDIVRSGLVADYIKAKHTIYTDGY